MTTEQIRAALAAQSPVPLAGPTLPAFPSKALPSWAGDMVEAVAEAMQTPVDLPGVTALGVLSACAAGRVEVQVRPGWRETLALYLAVVAESSERKSPVQRAMAAPLREAEQQLVEARAAERAQDELMREIAVKKADEAREKALATKDPHQIADALDLRRAAEELAVAPAPRLLAGGDATPEAIAQLLMKYRCIAIMDTEGGLFDLLAGRHSNGVKNLDAVLQAYSGDTIAVERRGRDPERVLRPALALTLAVQPVTLLRIVRDPDMTGRGLVARFLIAVPRPMVGRRRTGAAVRPVPDTVAEEYGKRVSALARGLYGWTDPAVLGLTTEARDVLYGFEGVVEKRLGRDGVLRPTGAWGGKLVGQAVRMAGLLHLAEQGPDRGPKTPVGPGAAAAAVELAEYGAQHAVAAFGTPDTGGDDSEAGEVLDKIRSAELRVFTLRDLHRKLRSARFSTASAVRLSVEVLEEAAWVARIDPNGRSWVAHPAIWDGGTR